MAMGSGGSEESSGVAAVTMGTYLVPDSSALIGASSGDVSGVIAEEPANLTDILVNCSLDLGEEDMTRTCAYWMEGVLLVSWLSQNGASLKLLNPSIWHRVFTFIVGIQF